jgi:prepilin-type processing-associated H-X9-DG protein
MPPQIHEIYQRWSIETGALWRYLKDEKIYCCPTGIKGQLVTYNIVDSMNGCHVSRNIPQTVDGKPSPRYYYKNVQQIINPSNKVVFIDEGRLSPDSYAVNYNTLGTTCNISNGYWFDAPPVRHSDGATVSYADGHSAYWKWKSKCTVEYGKKAETAKAVTQWITSCPGGPSCFVQQDLYKMRASVWGPQDYPTNCGTGCMLTFEPGE